MADSALRKNGSRRKRFGCIAAVICGILCIVLTGFACRYRHYETLAAYTAAGGRLPFPVPENAEDCRFAGRNVFLGRQYLYAFTLTEADAADYLAQLAEQHHLNLAKENVQFTDFEYWYGRTAADCAADPHSDGAPGSTGAFSQITERDTGSAEMLYYAPVTTGGRSFGILRFADTGEFICFEFLSR